MSTEGKSKSLKESVDIRRTFAIISHPDAGKTTLTEKLLLMGGAIHLAGSVKAKKSKKFATSDWMELEKQRGISVSTSVMNFEFNGFRCNLLDTPGHQDFSEDTYRTLTAVDGAIMLLDASKGVEPQTIKLFEVCKIRKIPIFTFVNKIDRDAREPLELMQEIENVLGIKTFPMVWPVGSGSVFQGVVERNTKKLRHFKQGQDRTSWTQEFVPLNDVSEIKSRIGDDVFATISEELDLLELAGDEFKHEEFMAGEITPVFFGSAMTNFGIQEFLNEFLTMAPPPRGKQAGTLHINPTDSQFSGFIFKIQANMDPRHRDRIAFLRVISGKFQSGLNVFHSRLDRQIKLSNAQQFFAQDRHIADDVVAGDIVGLYDPGIFAIGDSLGEKQAISFEGIPSFAPEFFGTVRTKNALKRKQLMKGLMQLGQEGTVQIFVDDRRAASDPVLAAVGVLQFEVLVFRLINEYNVECALENLPYEHARWTNATPEQIEDLRDKSDVTFVKDLLGNTVLLFKNDFHLRYFTQNFPKVELYTTNANVLHNMAKVSLDTLYEG